MPTASSALPSDSVPGSGLGRPNDADLAIALGYTLVSSFGAEETANWTPARAADLSAVANGKKTAHVDLGGRTQVTCRSLW